MIGGTFNGFDKMKVTTHQLRKIIREALESSSVPAFPPVSHPMISQYADKLGYKVKADRPDSWFIEYQSYTYAPKPHDTQAKQSINLFYLPNGKYHARISGAYNNTLSANEGKHTDPIDAIEAALNSSPGGNSQSAGDLLTKVGEMIDSQDNFTTWPD